MRETHWRADSRDSCCKKKNSTSNNSKKKKATCFALRLSCATPLLAPAAGALGVGVSSALAGQASLRARRNLKSDDAAGTPVPRQWRRADVLCDAAVGVLLFRAMGGRFRSLLPSDLVRECGGGERVGGGGGVFGGGMWREKKGYKRKTHFRSRPFSLFSSLFPSFPLPRNTGQARSLRRRVPACPRISVRF